MIVFDLACAQDHVFEAWFGSSEDYEAQRARGLVCCPLCGARDVSKAAMAPAIPAKGNSSSMGALAMHHGAKPPAEVKAMLAALARAQADMLSNSEHVGARFATEARAIHHGDAPERPIHGQATRDEAKNLIDDGIPVAPLPLPLVPPGTAH